MNQELEDNVFCICFYISLFFCLFQQLFILWLRMSRKQTPSDFLKQIIGRPVVVKLNSGADYRGIIISSLLLGSFFHLKTIFPH